MTDAVGIAADIVARERTAREVAEEALARAEADTLGAFWARCPERALAAADRVDAALAAGRDPGPLAGAPLAVKDCFDVAGEPTGSGIRGRAAMPPARADAAVLAPLAALPLVGKTAMHQLAWGMSGEARGYPANRNPVDPGRMPGGSSGGSATAVAAGIVPLALGTDSGGSVRQPAAWCGIVGLKPTLGTLPTDGCAPMARSLDTVGVLARSVRDVATALSLLTGSEPAAAAAPGRVGVVEELFEGCDERVAAACRAALARLEAAGAELVPVTLPWERRALGALYAHELAVDWGDRVEDEPDAFLAEVRAGIEAGRAVTAAQAADARAVLERARAAALDVVAAAGLELVAGPTTPLLALPLGEPDPTRVAGRNTRVFNGLGWPSLSLPCGRADGLPVGLMLSAPAGRDGALLAAALAVEDAVAG